MLRKLVICHLIVFITANPFHKYPFVFLLDVGNEELEKTNTEQLRVSAPGGSLALRYPAIGEGDTIAHIRVSGIDFGTDLKASIYDGGPGYNYVVLVFMGNPGVPYDAVVSVKTMVNDKVVDYNVETPIGNINVDNSNQVDDDPNDSAEDISDDTETQYRQKINAELTQSSSNVYKYAQNEESNGDDYQDDDSKHADDEKYERKQYKDYVYDIPNEINGGRNVEVKDYVEEGDISQDDDKIEKSDDVKLEKYSSNDDYDNNEGNEEPVRFIDRNLYEKYKALRPHLYDNVKIYPQESAQDQEGEEEYTKSHYNAEDPTEIDQMFNDEEIHNDAQKYRDSNNNNFDSDDSSAVAY